MVARTRLNVTLYVYYLSYLLLTDAFDFICSFLHYTLDARIAHADDSVLWHAVCELLI